ncbi:MAG: helicase C-terminal domain-containing protein, partial [bacterium]
ADLHCSAVLLKGRSNYLCRRRWQNLVNDSPLRLTNSERLALLPLVLWAQQTQTGDIAEVGAFGGEGSNLVWSKLQSGSERGSCRNQRCSERQRCFLNRVRAAASKAHIVVVNHALLMADIAAEHVPIGAYSTLIVDEAHHLERAACQHLGRELNRWALRSWCSRMYESEGVATGLLTQILLGLDALQLKHPVLPRLKDLVEFTQQDVSRLGEKAESFFQRITIVLQTEIQDAANSYSAKLRLRQPEEFFQKHSADEVEDLHKALNSCNETLHLLIETLGEFPAGSLPKQNDWDDDLSGSYEELLQIKDTFAFFREGSNPEWVCWAELPKQKESSALLYAAPLNAGEILRSQLFAPLRTAILTSATLTIADRFIYFLRKIGLDENESVQTLQLGSPFDFEKQMHLCLPAYLPSPRSPEFELQIVQLLTEILKRFPQGTLGLFTSHRMLDFAAATLTKDLVNRRVLVQGQSGSRDQLLRQFRDQPGSVLLGTDSFWEGIDVVGEALELLIVAKLPFEVPSEPLVEAKLEKLRDEGKDPFMYYTVPEAIIRLKQGIGRLIRSKSDRGAALICDSRLVKTRYGKAFLDSLPVPVRILQTQEEIFKFLEELFQSYISS